MSCSENGGKFRLERPDDKLHAAVPTEQTDFALDGLEKKLGCLDKNQVLTPETTAAGENIGKETRQYRIGRK
jgi:hypothetical protein